MASIPRSARRVLMVMAKEPKAGRVKTRLVPPLTAIQAAQLYEAFLRDTLELAGSIPGVDHGIAYTPPSAGKYFRRLARSRCLLIPQPAGNLGRRLHGLLAGLHAELGQASICLMNSDGPDLPPDYLSGAFDRLAGEADVVFGPNPDGGYYLVGMKSPAPIFTGVPWSSSRTLEESVARARGLGLRVSLLPPWPDLDTVDDLREALSRWRRGSINSARRTRLTLLRLADAGAIPKPPRR